MDAKKKEVEQFWNLNSPMRELGIKPKRADAPGAILKILNDSPYTIGKRNLVQYLDEMYAKISEAALKKSFSE